MVVPLHFFDWLWNWDKSKYFFPSSTTMEPELEHETIGLNLITDGGGALICTLGSSGGGCDIWNWLYIEGPATLGSFWGCGACDCCVGRTSSSTSSTRDSWEGGSIKGALVCLAAGLGGLNFLVFSITCFKDIVLISIINPV